MAAYNHLDSATNAIYAELVETLLASEAGHVGSPPAGSLVSKTVKGHLYWYLQLSELGARRQLYLGPDGPETRERLEAIEAGWRAGAAGRRSTARLVSMLLAAGVLPTDGTSGRVLEVLAGHHVFAAGAVLIGSHAFAAMGTALGVRWGAAYQTQDIDLASSRAIALAVARDADLPRALSDTSFAFEAIPGFDPRRPSTSFSVRGHTLRLDVLTTLVGRQSDQPIILPNLSVAAQPLRFLDYLLEDTFPAAIAFGQGVRITLPSPARFALHKLLVSEERRVHETAKQQKDLQQADALLRVLLDVRPGDIGLAWDALTARGVGWRRRVERALRRADPTVRARFDEAIR